MREIELTRDKVTLVSDEDFEFLNRRPWYCSGDGYAVRTDRTEPKVRKMYMHRIILERMGYVDFTDSDHTNRDKLDNQRSNLRPASRAENMYNRTVSHSSQSRILGVSWSKPSDKWRADIKVCGRHLYLGLFDTLDLASEARHQAELRYHGKFAACNNKEGEYA